MSYILYVYICIHAASCQLICHAASQGSTPKSCPKKVPGYVPSALTYSIHIPVMSHSVAQRPCLIEAKLTKLYIHDLTIISLAQPTSFIHASNLFNPQIAICSFIIIKRLVLVAKFKRFICIIFALTSDHSVF